MNNPRLVYILIFGVIDILASLWLLNVFISSLSPLEKFAELSWRNVAITLFSAITLTIGPQLIDLPATIPGIQGIYTVQGVFIFAEGLWSLRGTLFKPLEQISGLLKYGPSIVGVVMILLAILSWVNPIGG